MDAPNLSSIVPPEITHELTQILSNLVLGDNAIRSSAEQAVNERLAQTPELYILALAQFALGADTDVMRSFSLVLLRRLLFRPSTHPSSSSSIPQPHTKPGSSALYDHLSSSTLATLERLLLHSLLHEPNPKVRRNAVETVCDVANQAMRRGRPWHALQGQAFAMAQARAAANGAAPGHEVLGRASAYAVFAGAPNLIMDLQPESVLAVLKLGLEDPESVDVRGSALRASVAYLSSPTDPRHLSLAAPLLGPMLSTLAALAHALSHPGPPGASTQSTYHNLSVFLSVLTPLCTSHPLLFAPHLGGLLQLLSPLILPLVDSGPTPTVGRPFPSRSSSLPSTLSTGPQPSSSSPNRTFAFPPTSPPISAKPTGADTELDASLEHDLRQTLRLSALEFMLTLSEAKPPMVKRVAGWTETVVKACLEAMGEMDEDEEETDGDGDSGWRGEDPSSSSSDTDSPPALYEQSLDRLACALGGRAVLPSAFQYIPSMLLSYDWRSRHAGLMAIAAIGEGTGKVMLEQLGKVVDLVTPMFRDMNPRVSGQLCTDLEEVIQEQYHQQLFGVLIPALEDPEPRCVSLPPSPLHTHAQVANPRPANSVHAHAAAALINFCEGVARDTLIPYLDPIVERLLRLLSGPAGGGGADGSSGKSEPKRYVQEQAITTLAMVADASEVMFTKHYASIMPLLLNVLRNAEGAEYRKLRVKAMECAGLVAIAVGRDVFRPDAATLVELLIRIQNAPPDPADTQLGHYLIATWAKVCQAMGPEFEPYLHLVVPNLLQTASAKPDVSVYDDADADTLKSSSSSSPSSSLEDREGWETIVMDGRTLGIRTSAIEEKCQAFETLVIYCSTLSLSFAPYAMQTMEVALPALTFYYHDGVREASAVLIPMLLASGKGVAGGVGGMVEAAFHHLLACVRTEQDTSFLASLYKCINDCVRVVGGAAALPKEYVDGIVEVTKGQLQGIADRRRGRANRVQSQAQGGEAAGWGGEDREEMALMEEVEDFVLEDMGKMLSVLDPAHPLLVAVAGVKDLGLNTWESEEED
ncbi:hypothetical protein H0H87_007683 [Tephrocybe sp. NHM501043]|nr:hypothetical protein H0H87_007683 [Tephrocybe sp. NHM501043]